MSLAVALEIGTSRTVVSVGETGELGRVKVIGVGICPTIGVRKGQISDLKQVSSGIESALKQAEKMADTEIWQVIQIISGNHIQANTNSGTTAIRSHDRIVIREDIDDVKEIARAVPLDADRQILHTIEQTFMLDDQPGVVDPLGMRCNVLSTSVLAIHGTKNRIENAVTAAKSMQLNVNDVVFSGVVSALSTLAPEQKRNGVVLINLGGGTTSYVAYCNDVMCAAGCIAVGGDHVTNDIALAFNIPGNNAEDIKRSFGAAMLTADSTTPRIKIGADLGREERTIHPRALQTVINARMDEIFRVVLSKLNQAGILQHVGAGVVITGGGAYLKGVVDLAQHVFRAPCTIGLPTNVDGLEKADNPAALTAAAGALMYANMGNSRRGIFDKILTLFTKGS